MLPFSARTCHSWSARGVLIAGIYAVVLWPPTIRAEQVAAVRGVIPRAETPIVIDGQLSEAEYRGAFCTPLEYSHRDAANRPGQFFYLWDDRAFYVGLRTLDEKTYTPETPLWEGDAVEWYFDTRRGKDFLSHEWPTARSPGAVHCFFTAFFLDELRPRFTLRPGFEQAIEAKDVKVGARRWESGLEVEFQLPWSNFPEFKPAVEEVIGIDAELSYSDGGRRSDRSFIFGNPLSVDHPANLARVELVDKFKPSDWQACGPVMMPIRIDLPWTQETKPHFIAQIAMPPGRSDEIGKIEFQVTDLEGQELGRYEADSEMQLDATGYFVRREARWPTTLAAPGTFHVHAVVYDRHGKELARVAPRLTSVNAISGY